MTENPFDDVNGDYDWGVLPSWDTLQADLTDIQQTAWGLADNWSAPDFNAENEYVTKLLPKLDDFVSEFAKISRLTVFNGDPFRDWVEPDQNTADYLMLMVSFEEREALLKSGYTTRSQPHPTFTSARNWLEDAKVITHSAIYFDGVHYWCLVGDTDGASLNTNKTRDADISF